MRYSKLKDGSYVHNCLLVRREDDPSEFMFLQDGDKGIRPFLNGYAIVPLKKYMALIGEEFDDAIIKMADEELSGCGKEAGFVMGVENDSD